MKNSRNFGSCSLNRKIKKIIRFTADETIFIKMFNRVFCVISNIVVIIKIIIYQLIPNIKITKKANISVGNKKIKGVDNAESHLIKRDFFSTESAKYGATNRKLSLCDIRKHTQTVTSAEINTAGCV